MQIKLTWVVRLLGAVTALALLAGLATLGSGSAVTSASERPATMAQPLTDQAPTGPVLKKYLIPRVLPGAEGLSSAQWKENSAGSNEVIRQMQDEGKQIYWLESFVGKDSVTCVYLASGPELLYEHARRGGFPVSNVIEIARMIEPATAK